jgi:UDP-N-acetylmuramoylalanine--D-glutamate ligase
MSRLADLDVLVLGLGESGLAMARWCARQGARVRIWDSRAEPPGAAALAEQVPQAHLVGGELNAGSLGDARLVLKSPGLAPHDPRIARLLDASRARGVAVSGELDLFVQALAELKSVRGYAPRLLAITGTNGKTTTTAMTALLVERSGLTVAAAGNIGPTMLDTLRDALDRAGADDAALPQVWVLELSSFQLDAVQDFDPDAAAVLNLSQDHLDWHGTFDAYAAAKARIFGPHTTWVVNRDDPAVEAMVPAPAPARPGRFGRPRPVERRVVRFGLDAPRAPGDFGLVVENAIAWLVCAQGEPAAGARAQGDGELRLQRLMPADALRVRGRHNAANALAALALGRSIGCPLATMLHALRDYRGEPHRLEFIASVGGVEAFDDSKGTNVGATVAALEGLGVDKAPAKLALILGGDGKGQDFAPLAQPVLRHARAVALIGRDAAAIEAVLGPKCAQAGLPIARHASLPDAVSWCFAQARPGDAVLLSPACASLDMFRNYAHRAEVFVDAVRAHAAELGEVT